MHMLFYVAIILISGIVMGRVVSKFKLPNVTGYLIAGVLIGPSLLSLIPADVAANLGIISEAALGFIAYSIGSEFNLNLIKKTGGKIILITVCEALGAVIMVVLAMIFIFKQSVAFSLVLGSIAAATAPAATIMVIRQYRAKGPLVSTLLPVVAMDDAVGIVVFGVAVAVADTIASSGQDVSFLFMVLKPFLEIALALLVGFVIGLVLSYASRKARGKDDLLSISIATIFLTLGIAEFLNVSTLLCCMMLGATVSNMTYGGDKVISIIDRFTPPVFIAFFTMAGVDLQLDVLKSVGLIGIGYVVFRVIGKILGASLGAKMTKAPDVVQKYLGYTLIPQAGVAIGLSMLAESALPGMGVEIRTIILAGTVVYELVGPVVSKMALMKAGEIAPEYRD
ncbi:MAG TPA: cation:proton antiporter [Thermoanaerobacterales bacterium]|nr:cation:proton antiporter [Thermoanaerobacterales bacterium]